MLTPMLPMAMVALAGFTPNAVMPAAGKVATCRTPAMLAPHRRTASPLLAQRCAAHPPCEHAQRSLRRSVMLTRAQ